MAIKYKWLAGTLRDLIKKDVKNQINKLPSEQELCRRYHVSRQTVRQALNLLTQEGLIEKRMEAAVILPDILQICLMTRLLF